MINLFCTGFSTGCASVFFAINCPYVAVTNLFAGLLNFFIWYTGDRQ